MSIIPRMITRVVGSLYSNHWGMTMLWTYHEH